MAALQQFPWMDGKRLSACGASYGGFMVRHHRQLLLLLFFFFSLLL
jgi:hypothetical protein